jgi:hypothetical protein
MHGPHQFTDHFEIEVDFRGETLHYIEGDQRTSMMWFWTSGYSVQADTLGPWINADGSTTPVTEEEAKIILQRVVQHALETQNVKLRVE